MMRTGGRDRDWLSAIELDRTYSMQYSADFPPDKLEKVARKLWGDDWERCVDWERVNRTE